MYIYYGGPIPYQFAEPLRIENFAIRSSGELLLNLLPEPLLYSLDPVFHSSRLIHTFPNATGLYGIAEDSHEVFSVVVGKYSLEIGTTVPNSQSVYEVTFEGSRDGFLYWTNSDREAVYRIQIDEGGYALPDVEVELVLNVGERPDDFTFDSEGDMWITTHRANTVVVARAGDGEAASVVGSSTEMTVAGATACRFGRRDGDHGVLYVVTDGAQVNPVNGTVTEGEGCCC